MELQKECNGHMVALEQLIQTSLNLIDTSTTNSQITLSEYWERVISLKEEDDRNLEGIKEKIKGLQTTHKSNQDHLDLLEKKVEDLKREKQNLQEQQVFKKKNLARIKKDLGSHKKSLLEIKRRLAKVVESQNTLNRNKNELLLYKQLTGISWDFEAAPNLVQGYVTNKDTGYLKPFCFDKEKMSSWQITDALWELISASSVDDLDD